MNENDERLHVNGNNFDDNDNSDAFGIALAPKTISKVGARMCFSVGYHRAHVPSQRDSETAMKTYNNLYPELISFENLILAWKRARKGKNKKAYVIEFESALFCNLMCLHYELKFGTYAPRPLKAFVIRDPKTRLIHKSDFRDRIVHHALVAILERIYEPRFIADSCANRIGKGSLYALKRFEKYCKKISRNGGRNGWFTNNQIKGYCLKADIYHYFREVDQKILLAVLKRIITDQNVIRLIRQILFNNANSDAKRERERDTCARYAARQPDLAVLCKCLSQ